MTEFEYDNKTITVKYLPDGEAVLSYNDEHQATLTQFRNFVENYDTIPIGYTVGNRVKIHKDYDSSRNCDVVVIGCLTDTHEKFMSIYNRVVEHSNSVTVQS